MPAECAGMTASRDTTHSIEGLSLEAGAIRPGAPFPLRPGSPSDRPGRPSTARWLTGQASIDTCRALRTRRHAVDARCRGPTVPGGKHQGLARRRTAQIFPRHGQRSGLRSSKPTGLRCRPTLH